jgi:hypothetical protein
MIQVMHISKSKTGYDVVSCIFLCMLFSACGNIGYEKNILFANKTYLAYEKIDVGTRGEAKIVSVRDSDSDSYTYFNYDKNQDGFVIGDTQIQSSKFLEHYKMEVDSVSHFLSMMSKEGFVAYNYYPEGDIECIYWYGSRKQLLLCRKPEFYIKHTSNRVVFAKDRWVVAELNR